MNNSIIKHQGIVQCVKDKKIEVLILSESGCASCKSKNYCSVAEVKEKLIQVNYSGNQYKVGDSVNVIIEEKTGLKAILFAYFIPFIVMISFLFIGNYMNMNEPVMGIGAVLLLAVYYVVIYLLRGYFNKKITFSIE